MTELEDLSKRSQALAQLEHVCHTHRALAERLNNRPFELRVTHPKISLGFRQQPCSILAGCMPTRLIRLASTDRGFQLALDKSGCWE